MGSGAVAALVSGIVGAGLSAVVVVAGVTTYNAQTTGEVKADPASVGYADE